MDSRQDGIYVAHGLHQLRQRRQDVRSGNRECISHGRRRLSEERGDGGDRQPADGNSEAVREVRSGDAGVGARVGLLSRSLKVVRRSMSRFSFCISCFQLGHLSSTPFSVSAFSFPLHFCNLEKDSVIFQPCHDPDLRQRRLYSLPPFPPGFNATKSWTTPEDSACMVLGRSFEKSIKDLSDSTQGAIGKIHSHLFRPSEPNFPPLQSPSRVLMTQYSVS